MGPKLTESVSDWPGSSVALDDEPLRLNPVPLTEIFEIFAFEFPVFLMVVDNVSVVPTFTFPKLSDARLNSSTTGGTSYSDSTVADGQVYYYVVTAVNSSNIESTDSNQVSATIPSN